MEWEISWNYHNLVTNVDSLVNIKGGGLYDHSIKKRIFIVKIIKLFIFKASEMMRKMVTSMHGLDLLIILY